MEPSDYSPGLFELAPIYGRNARPSPRKVMAVCSVRVPDELLEAVRARAEVEERAFSAVVIDLLSAWVSEDDRQPTPAVGLDFLSELAASIGR
jgi:hypothetical protein